MTWYCTPSIYSQGQVAASSQTCRLDIDLLAQSKLTHTPERFCWHGSLTAAYLNSLFGMMCEHSEQTTQKQRHTSSGYDQFQMTWRSAADFHVKTSAQQAVVMELPEKNRGCGLNLHASFAILDRTQSLWKIPQDSLLGDCTLFLATWPQWGLMQDGVCWRLPKSARITSGNVSGLLPTPTATNAKQGVNSMAGGASHGVALLPKAAVSWPTPTAQDAKNNGGASQHTHNTKPLNAEVGGALNPDWVCWLMGWPIGWVNLEPLPNADPHTWAVEPHDLARITKGGCTHRVSKLRALGNGQVPQCAMAAYTILSDMGDK